MEILVFKTNLTDAGHISNVRPFLNIHPHIMQWNVDLHDCDKILRVVGKIDGTEVEQLISKAGYFCQELE